MVSVGALLDRLDLVDLAAENGGRIVVATGALLGLDAVRAAAEGEIASVGHPGVTRQGKLVHSLGLSWLDRSVG